jgi:hypothetical protein
MLGFLQKHFNKILSYKNPAYEFEFAGYERDDPKVTLDMDRGEIESYKTLNEKRAEKGMEPVDFENVKNPADMPLNSCTVQLFQGLRQGGGSPFGDMEGYEGGEEPDGGGFEPEGEEGGEAGSGSGWDDIEAQQAEGGEMGKSLGGGRGAIRIVI